VDIINKHINMSKFKFEIIGGMKKSIF